MVAQTSGHVRTGAGASAQRRRGSGKSDNSVGRGRRAPAVLASGSVTVSQAREQLTAAVQTILDAGITARTLRDDVRAEDIVATIVGAIHPRQQHQAGLERLVG